MIDRARESRNPKKVIRVTLMESYGEIGRVPVNLMEIERTEICGKYCSWDMAVGRITDSVFDETINFSQKWKKNVVSVLKY